MNGDFLERNKSLWCDRASKRLLESIPDPNPDSDRGLYNVKYPPPPGGRGEISADVIWGEKYEKAKRKRRNMWKKREERGKKRK